MLPNGRHTNCLHVPFLFHWHIYGQQPSSTSSPRDKRKKAEWTSKKQTSVDDVKNKASILNRITIVFHHCGSLKFEHFSRNNYVWVWWFVWNTRSFPQRSYLEKCVSNTISPVLQSTAGCLLLKKCHVHEYSFLFLKTSRRERESGFRNPGIFCLWNPEYWALESRISANNPESNLLKIHSRLNWATRSKEKPSMESLPKTSTWRQNIGISGVKTIVQELHMKDRGHGHVIKIL